MKVRLAGAVMEEEVGLSMTWRFTGEARRRNTGRRNTELFIMELLAAHCTGATLVPGDIQDVAGQAGDQN